MHSIKAHAKVNIFLKITGHKEGYHTLVSRFIRVEDLYDTITLESCECDAFTIEGCDGVPINTNTIYKAYNALIKHTNSEVLADFFKKHKVVVTKKIPSKAGLAGGSSDAAAFMRLINEICDLQIEIDELAKIGSSVGADLPFFIYNYASANVSGFGEIVREFKEEPFELELFTPDIECDTTEVYKTFNKYLLQYISLASFFGWENLDSRTILNIVPDPIALNDLYPAALVAYPQLEELDRAGWFFTGSGSTFFRLK